VSRFELLKGETPDEIDLELASMGAPLDEVQRARVQAAAAGPLAEVRAAIEADLPRPDVEVKVLLPYDRGDLVSKIHDKGEVVEIEHTGEGTVVQALVSEALAGELEPYAVASVD